MNLNKLISHLEKEKKNYIDIKSFSKLLGIYAIYFSGKDFPAKEISIEKNKIIYIGKTESSQEKRDAKTHFNNGKTGSSTVRRSIGAILREKYKLNPIPRNDSDYLKGRLSHFKFDKESEEKITYWMKNNLALSFYEYSMDKKHLDKLETELIQKLIPVLNIDKNPNNPFREQIQLLRKKCSQIAIKQKTNKFEKLKKVKSTMDKSSKGKYISLWRNKLLLLQQKIELCAQIQSIQLSAQDFITVGNRKSYSFNLEFFNGSISNNIGGSAVARDFASVIYESDSIRSLIKDGHYKLNMDKNFCLWIQKIQ